MSFDPNQPFTVVGGESSPASGGGFDPNQPFTVVKRSPAREFGRQLGIGTRKVIEGVAGYNPVAIAADAVGGVANELAGVTEPGASPYQFYPLKETVASLLDRIGLPRAQTEAEQRVGRVVELGSGAIGGASLARGAGALGAGGYAQVFGANPVQQTIISTAGPATGETLRAAGVQEPWPTIAEFGTGLLVPGDAAMSGVARGKDIFRSTGAGTLPSTAPARTVGAVKDVATSKGRQNVVGRILRASSNDPKKAEATIGRTRAYVAGSRPTIGQASGDVGLQRLERIADKTLDVPDVVSEPGQFAAQRIANNRARVAAFEKLQPVDARFEALRQGINRRFQPRLDAVMANRQPVPTAPLVATVDGILATPGIGKRAELVSVLEYTRERLTALGDQVDPLDLQALRQDLAELVEGKLKGAATRDGRAVGGGVKGLSRSVMRSEVIDGIDSVIEAGAPGYRDKWLRPYAAARQALERRNIVGQAYAQTKTTATDSEGVPILSPAGLTRWIEKNSKKVERLTPQQRQTLFRIRADLQRSVRGENATVQGGGSDTGRALVGGASVAAIIGRAMGSGPQRSPVPFGDKFRWLFGYTDRQINDLLIEAMTDPKVGRLLLAKANEEAAEEASRVLQDLATKRAVSTSQINVQKD